MANFRFGEATFAVLLALVLVSVPAGFVQADAWWGEGYREPEWVLRHGGSIIYYQVKGKDSSGSIKARMYLGDKLIETEYGSRGVFDDAIKNTYSVIIFRGSKKKMSTVLDARPGETIQLIFDLDKKTARSSSLFVSRSNIKLNSDSSQSAGRADMQAPQASAARKAPVSGKNPPASYPAASGKEKANVVQKGGASVEINGAGQSCENIKSSLKKPLFSFVFS